MHLYYWWPNHYALWCSILQSSGVEIYSSNPPTEFLLSCKNSVFVSSNHKTIQSSLKLDLLFCLVLFVDDTKVSVVLISLDTCDLVISHKCSFN